MASFSGNVTDITNLSVCESLRCSICLDILTSPKALPCLHTFCEECIQANITAASVNKRPRWIVCPECRQQTTPPENCAPTEWANQLPTNWPLKGFIERLLNQATSSDVLETEEAADQRSINQNDLEECKKIEICQTHEGKTLKYYCMDHSTILCEACKSAGHEWGCSVETIDSIAQGTVTENVPRVQSEMDEIREKLDSMIRAMKEDMKSVKDTVEGFQSRLLKLRNEVDLLMNEMQYELASTEFRDLAKSKFTKSHKNTITECDSLKEALRFSKSELDVIEKYGTPAQRFIAVVRLSSLIPMFKKAADDNATSATRVEIRHEGIEILDSIVRMQKDMRNIQSVGVKLS